MRAVLNLAMKDLRLLVRDKMGLFWVVVFPLLMALFFGSIFSSSGGGARSLKIAAVQDNVSPLGKLFFKELSKTEVLKIHPLGRDSARLLVSRGALVAYVEFTGSGESVFALFGEDKATIEVGIDPARRAEAGFLNGLISQAYYKLMQSAMTDSRGLRRSIGQQRANLDTATGVDRATKGILGDLYSTLDTFLVTLNTLDSATGDSSSAAASPFGQVQIEFKDVAEQSIRPRSSFEITFPQGLQWALIGCAASFALSIVVERTRGTFMRLRLAPISRFQILAGKGLACFIANSITCLMLLLIGVLIFKVNVASPIGLLAAVLCASFCFVGLMMMMSVLGKTEASVSGTGWGLFMIFSMTGGGMVPLMMMPSWMVSVSHFSPVKWSVLAAEGAIWRGFGFAELLQPLGILLAIGAIGFTIGVMILKRTDG